MTDSRPLRAPLVVLIIVSLLAAGVLRQVALSRRQTFLRAGTQVGAGLNELSSFSLILLLGGLRGALVMMLWPSTESQKQQKDLTEINTDIELIRLLQPEYDSVHLYQIWNKAYNLSQQMASLPNKYLAILDGLDYAQKVDAVRPNNINIIAAIADLYQTKLGGSEEKVYYARRVRQETKWRPPDKVFRSRVDNRLLKLDPMLDRAGDILPKYLTPKVHCPPNTECNDGSELQYLRPYQPFPYGIPPLGLGYNYSKRAQVLLTTTHQKHLQLSDYVINSHPAISLKIWSEREELDGFICEADAYGSGRPNDPTDAGAYPLPTVNVTLQTPIRDRALLEEAAYHFGLCARLVDDAQVEYKRLLLHNVGNASLYRSHVSELQARKALAMGDREFTLAALAPNDQRSGHVQAALQFYRQAVHLWSLYILRYGPSGEQAANLYGNPDRLDHMGDEEIAALVYLYHQRIQSKAWDDAQHDQRLDWENCLYRAIIRYTSLPPATP